MKCQICKSQRVIWYGQAMNGANGKLTFTAPGSHYRGFGIIKVCDSCKTENEGLSAIEVANKK